MMLAIMHGGQLFFYSASHVEDQFISVIPLALERARIVRHRGFSPAHWEVLEGW